MARPIQTGVTLDGPTTRDIDDAFNLRVQDGRHILDVYIADVARGVEPGTEIDERARQMTATRYYGHGNSPMLPRSLSEDKLSLWPDRTRRVVHLTLTFGPDLAVQETKVQRSTLISTHKLSYEQVPVILKNDQHPLHALFNLAVPFAFALLEKRRQSGAMVLYDLNNGWITTEDGFLKQIEDKSAVVGQILIQEFMVAANQALSEYALRQQIPILFRNHVASSSAPDRAELLGQLQDALFNPMHNLDVVRRRVHLLLERARYSPTVRGHYGLNLPYYTHFTSPIRRYADLVNHRQVVAELRGEPLPYSMQDLEQVAQHINDKTDQDRQEQSDAMKQKAEGKAERSGQDARRLDSLNAKEFERVLKVQTRSGEPPTPALQEAFVRRLRERRVPTLCLEVVMVGAPQTEDWKTLRQAILGFLTDHPHEAPSLLMQASQISGWGIVQYDGTGHGPDHSRTFNATATVQTDSGETCRGTYGGARTAKEAQQKACVGLLAARYDLSLVWVGEPLEIVPPPPAVPTPDSDKDPVMVLHEFCQAERLNLPTYTYQQEGPDHAPTVTCRCQLLDVQSEAKAGTKKDAKREAVKKMLVLISDSDSAVE